MLNNAVKAYCVGDESKDLISIEYEVPFDPGTVQRREIWDDLTTHALVTPGVYPTTTVILEALRKIWLEEFPWLEGIGFDGGGLE